MPVERGIDYTYVSNKIFKFRILNASCKDSFKETLKMSHRSSTTLKDQSNFMRIATTNLNRGCVR